ncbi:MAG: 4-vinyl reductase, partial [Anaerolinea sp.]|nr:4-vinyl reductase [Anaerolinea sp.]
VQAGVHVFHDQLPPDDLEPGLDFAALAAINAALDTLYGQQGGRGMALRAGRAWFSGGMRMFGVFNAMADPAFRALSLDRRVSLGLAALVDVFTHFSDQRSALEVSSQTYILQVAPSPMAWGLRAARPVCQPLVGLVQEGMRWFSNGREYSVRETHCQAAGHDACRIAISRQPLP